MTPATVSDDGSVLNFHRAGMDPVQIAVDGADLSNDLVIFRVEGGPTVTLTADPEHPAGKLLHLTLDELAAIPQRGADFFLRNETSGDVLLEGRVFVRGFA